MAIEDGRHVVWLGRGLSNVYDALRIVRDADVEGALFLVASDSRWHAPALTIADEALSEPRRLSSAAFAEWSLEVCRQRRVDVYLPGRHHAALTRRRAEFEALGTRLMTPAAPEVLAIIEDKVAIYTLLGPEVPQPEWRVFRGVDEFDTAVGELRHRHAKLCLKPVSSMFGLGFHILDDRVSDPHRRFLGAEPLYYGYDEVRDLLRGAASPPRMLLMELLPGAERSIDCLAHRGRLVRGVVRRKKADHQVIEIDGPALDIAAEVIARLGLDGLVNVQTKDDVHGAPKLLEVNARMSGGMHQACLAGVPLPYWAVRLALGTARPEDVPAAAAGQRVMPVQAAIVVGRNRRHVVAPGASDAERRARMHDMELPAPEPQASARATKGVVP